MRKQRFSVLPLRVVLCACLLALLAACGRPAPAEKRATGKTTQLSDSLVITDEVRLPCTPVKQQGHSSLCWIYAMLATIETEHLVKGDSVNLSPLFLARQYLAAEAESFYFARGKGKLSQRGMSPMTLRLLGRYGAQPYDYYHAHQQANMNVLWRRVAQLARTAAVRREGVVAFRRQLGDLLDKELGFVPRFVHMLGAEYTNEEFGRSVCMKGEYEALTSFSHHPYGTRFQLEVPDNVMGDTFLNVPLDTLMAVVNRSLRNGHPVCWEGDISEDGFSFQKGLATLEEDCDTTQRQREFETFQTTDDHCMALVGLARDNAGRRYYLAKNSWGTGNRFGGYMYLSEDYVRMKTICIVVHRDQR